MTLRNDHAAGHLARLQRLEGIVRPGRSEDLGVGADKRGALSGFHSGLPFTFQVALIVSARTVARKAAQRIAQDSVNDFTT